MRLEYPRSRFSVRYMVSVAQTDRARQNGYRLQSQVPEAPKGINRPTAGKLRKAWWRREAGNPDDMLMKRVRVRILSEIVFPSIRRIVAAYHLRKKTSKQRYDYRP